MFARCFLVFEVVVKQSISSPKIGVPSCWSNTDAKGARVESTRANLLFSVPSFVAARFHLMAVFCVSDTLASCYHSLQSLLVYLV